MPDWATFAGVAAVVTVLVLLLARASESLVSGGTDADSHPGTDAADTLSPSDSAPESDWAGTGFEPAVVTTESASSTTDTASNGVPAESPSDRSVPPNRLRDPPISDLPTSALLLNVAVTQAFFACFLLGGIWYAQVPLSALGIEVPTREALALGGGLGVVLFVLNQVAARAGRQFGLGGGEELRNALAPDSFVGWVLLLGIVLPVVAGFEELLFRGALVGGLQVGFGYSPWLLALVSSAAFALGHGAQGRIGIVVTGVLGFVFAAAFVVTDSLAVVVVAHYLVNALEFVVYEGVGASSVGE